MCTAPLLVLLAATGCLEANERRESITSDSAGVRIVQSAGPDRPLYCQFAEVFRLGGADAGPESFFRIEPRGIKVGRDDRIYVLDRGNYRVLVFTAAGEFSRSLGRRGGGPGELGAPVALSIEPDGAVAVLDYTKRGLTRFAPDGTALASQRIELMYTGERLAHTTKGLLLDLAEGYRGEEATVRDRLVRLEPDGTVRTIASLARSRPEVVQYTGCVSIALHPLFAADLNWDANAERVVVNSTVEYEIDVFRGLEKTASYRRDIPPREVDRSVALSELGEGTGVVTPQGKCVIDPAEELAGRGFAKVLPAISELAISPDGAIWVRRRTLRGEAPLIDILGPHGQYVGTLFGERRFPAAFLSSEVFIVRETDALDIEYVVAYSMTCPV